MTTQQKAAKRRAEITLKMIRDAAPAERPYFIWDTLQPGMALVTYPSGRQAFIVSLWDKIAGKERRETLGAVGVLKLRDARDEAGERVAEHRDEIRQTLREARKLGVDPLVLRQRQQDRAAIERVRATKTVRDLKDRYMAAQARRKKPTSLSQDEALWNMHILPEIGGKLVDEISKRDIEKLHQKMTDAGIPIRANRMLALLSHAFRSVEGDMVRDPDAWRGQHTNPVFKVERNPENKRDRYLLPRELAKLGEVLTAMEDEQLRCPDLLPMIRMLILTGCRRGELMTAKWSYLDREKKALNLPDSKSGARTVPLSDAAMDELDKLRDAHLRRDNGKQRRKGDPLPDPNNEYIFRGRLKGEPMSHGKMQVWNTIRKRAGIPDVRIHDLRHTYASICGGMLGIDIGAVGHLLGHRQTSTTERYRHFYEDPIREHANAAGAKVVDLMAVRQVAHAGG